MSTSVAGLSTNFFPSPQNGFTTTLASTISSGATTVPLNSVAGFTNGDIAVLVVDPANASKQTFTGVVDTAGTQLTSVVWTAGTNVTHLSGATVTDYATATHIAMIAKGLLKQHVKDGTHGAVTATSLSSSGGITMTAGTFSPTGLWDGWVGAGESWAYASATTITVPSDATTKYSVGDKIKLTQSASVKYFYVTSVAATVLTINGGTDYTLTNSAITSNYYSKSASPVGFPDYFAYSPSWGSAATQPAIGNGTNVGRFAIKGRQLHAAGVLTPGTTTTYGTGQYNLSIPINTANKTGMTWTGPVTMLDNATARYTATALVGPNSTTFNIEFNYSAVYDWDATHPWTFGSGDSVFWSITCEI